MIHHESSRKAMENNKKEIFQNIVQIQENERKRIAEELHDVTLQSLVHITHQVELAILYLDEDTNKTKLELAKVKQNIKDLMDDTRKVIYNVRPMSFDDLGFIDALKYEIKKLNDSSKIEFSYSFDESVHIDDSLIKLSLYRCVQECLQNCIKHSDATKVLVEIKRDEYTPYIIISDNGIGMDYESMKNTLYNHFGLSMCRERISAIGGTMEIDSKPGEGTTIRFIAKDMLLLEQLA
jgi:two-component system sensor histidine kinase DegS